MVGDAAEEDAVSASDAQPRLSMQTIIADSIIISILKRIDTSGFSACETQARYFHSLTIIMKRAGFFNAFAL